MTRKVMMVAMSTLLSATMFLGGCGSSSSEENKETADAQVNEESTQDDAEDSQEEITLRMSFWADEADLAMWEEGIEAFEADHPNVTIELESIAWGEYWTKLNTQMATGSQADIVGMVSMYAQHYIENGALYDFSELAEKDGTDLSVYWPNIMQAYQDDEGGLYCLPYDLSTMLMIVNKDRLEEAGIEYNPDGYTQEEFLEVCKQLTTDGKYALYWYATDWSYYDILFDAGIDIFDENGKLCLNTPEIIELTQWLADLSLVEGVNASYNATDGGANFTSGLAAITVGNPETLAAYKEMVPEGTEIDVMRLPFADKENRKKLSEGGSFGISSQTEYPELCWEFLKYYCSAENLNDLVAENFRGIPGTSDAVPTFEASEKGVEHAELYTEPLASLDTSAWITYENRTEIETELGTYLQAIWIGDMTAEEALNEFQEKVVDAQ